MSRPEMTAADLGSWWSDEENCVVEHRGAMMGKIYIYDPEDHSIIRAEMLWCGKDRISVAGIIEPHRDQKERAIRALATSPWGAKALTLGTGTVEVAVRSAPEMIAELRAENARLKEELRVLDEQRLARELAAKQNRR